MESAVQRQGRGELGAAPGHILTLREREGNMVHPNGKEAGVEATVVSVQ